MRALRLLLLLVAAVPAVQAAVQSVRPLPARVMTLADQDLVSSFTWQIQLDFADSGGAVSFGGTFFNAATGAPLGGAVPTTVGVGAGGGLLSFPETLNVPAATLRTWYDQGVRRLGYRRTFTTPSTGSNGTGQLLIDLSRATLGDLREPRPGELRVLRMELEFGSGKRIEVSAQGAALDARLTLMYSGSGTLRGRWQIAEPGGGANPFFRTLSLARENLAPAQRTTLASPRLPTLMSGRYVLRFCLDPAGAAPTEDCADSSAGVQTLYEVSEPQPGALQALSPAGGSAGASSVFRWSATPGVTIYQLQILRVGAGEALEFVTGLLVPATSPDAVLSQLALSKLEPGVRYRWRVTAHDAEGKLVARTETAEFVYRP